MNSIVPFHALLKCNRENIWTAKLRVLLKSSVRFSAKFSAKLTALVLVAFCSACANIQPIIDPNVTIDFPSTEPIVSEKQADAVLKAVSLSRAQVEWRFEQMAQICNTKFFMNSCMSEASDLRRADLERINKSEVEAKFFKRKNMVEDKDRALDEMNRQKPLPEVMPGLEH